MYINKRYKLNYLTTLLASSLLAPCLLINQALANPVLEGVVEGKVAIQEAPNSVTVVQSTDKAIINWQSFNIAQNEKTHFDQPANGIALNRINPSQGVSKIYGSLSATGKIILVNSAGFYFGPNAFVNVGGLVATATGDITNQNFMQGNYIFDQIKGSTGSITNDGTIKAADYGLVALVGNEVINNGLIEAKLGQVNLGSGEQFYISFDEGNIGFVLQGSQQAKSGVTNKGTINADGGLVVIQAAGAASVLDNTINLDGVIQTNTVSQVDSDAGQRGGVIILGFSDNESDESSTININGKISASGTDTNTKGGLVLAASTDINVGEGAMIDVSGDQGGGLVMLFGPYITSNGDIRANALTNGDGGAIIMNGYYTSAYGKLSAKGGANSGNGGLISINGEYSIAPSALAFGLIADVSAPHGNPGVAQRLNMPVEEHFDMLMNS